MPQPTRNAKTKAVESPKNILNQILLLGIGWLNSNSINWLLLYTYIVENMILTNGTTRSTMFNKLKVAFV